MLSTSQSADNDEASIFSTPGADALTNIKFLTIECWNESILLATPVPLVEMFSIN